MALAQFVRTLTLCVVLSGVTTAQTGNRDQKSPFGSEAGVYGATAVSYDVSDPGNVWQIPWVAGVDGSLEGMVLECTGPIGATANVIVRKGKAWSVKTPLWSRQLTKLTAGTEQVFLAMSGVPQEAGRFYVLEIVGDGSGLSLTGTTRDPFNTLYPLKPWLNQVQGPDQYLIGFETYVRWGPELKVTGSCGGTMTFEVTQTYPNTYVLFVWSHNLGSSFNPFWICPNTRLDLAEPVRYGGWFYADAAGQLTVSKAIPAQACGRVWVQAVASAVRSGCEPSNPVLLQ